MGDLISKALLSGLGLASLTKDAIQKAAQDLVDQSKISEDEGRRLVKDLHHKSMRAQKALEKHVDKAVHTALENLDVFALISDRLKKSKSAGKKSPRRSASKSAKR
jgi:polyhydroxyalkanoate synthesis regulator phasin